MLQVCVELLAKSRKVFQHGLLDVLLLRETLELLQARLNGLPFLVEMIFAFGQLSLLDLFFLEQIQQPLPLAFQRLQTSL